MDSRTQTRGTKLSGNPPRRHVSGENDPSKEHVYPNVHGGTIYNRQKHASIQNVQLLTKMEQKVSYVPTVDYNSAIKK